MFVAASGAPISPESGEIRTWLHLTVAVLVTVFAPMVVGAYGGARGRLPAPAGRCADLPGVRRPTVPVVRGSPWPHVLGRRGNRRSRRPPQES